MKQAIINIKTDPKLKREAQELAEEMGLSLSAVINGKLKEFVDRREMLFDAPLKLKPEVEEELKQAINDYKRGENIVGPFKTTEELDSYLTSL